MSVNVKIRPYGDADADSVWCIIEEVIAGGETYVFNPDTSREKMLYYWLAPNKKVYVALLDDEIVATFTIQPNMPDRASHVSNASYMVSPQQARKGIGELIGRYSLEEARRLGYTAMQFNIVIKSNEPAVKLWQKIGFRIIGEVPNAFRHPRLGLTNVYIMYREL